MGICHPNNFFIHVSLFYMLIKPITKLEVDMGDKQF